jgi:hypothetical protein
MATTPTVGQGLVWPTGSALQPLTDCVSGGACAHVLYEGSVWILVILVLVIGGGCAIMSGRSVALGWKPARIAVFYGALLSVAVRFLHFGLLRGTLFSLYYLLIDAVILMLMALASYRFTRAGQMARQYPWKFKRSGPFSWIAL